MGIGMVDMNDFAGLLELGLRGKLPGVEAQERMAPSDRIHGEYPAKPNADTFPGAVLILLYPIEDRIYTVMIQRPEYPGVQSNQISFPGGKRERGDKSMVETAIREAEEEVGISGNKIRVCGFLSPLFIPVSNIEVTPVVGIQFSRPVFTPDPAEVSFIIEAGMNELSDPSIKKEKSLEVHGQLITVPYYQFRDLHIWGATAMIISEFLDIYSNLNI